MAMTPLNPSPIDTKLVAGELCLDFANTAEWHASATPIELLKTYGDLVTWSRRVGLVDAPAAGRLLREARRRPDDAAAVLKRAITVREAIYGLVLAFLQLRPPAASVLEGFNRELRTAFQHVQVVPGPQGLTWNWDFGNRDLEAMLWPIIRSAAELLTSERQARIGQCADDRGCGWLFLDTTKNRSRRWCAMEDCGNRAKARRHYQRSRAPGARSRKA
ncbi:MAG: ABATE domain-containing protein [Acidobacteriia bacterium]|nr:ABATE domain-containing protein [Terriglobia bacterium]